MFVGFFYLLRSRGLGVSINEWITLMEGLLFGLHGSTISGFYNLCRAVLVKSEADYDKYDQVFREFFEGIPLGEDVPEKVLQWLSNKEEALKDFKEFLRTQGYEEKTIEEILEQFRQRLQEQTEEHNGGSRWIGTGGYTNFGHSGHSPQGIRVAGEGHYRRAFQVLGDRKFRDFRKDNRLDIRQFQMAFRLLRQYSERVSEAPTEFDVDGTVRKTCDNAGTLSVQYKKPRRNTVKVLLLMDSGGSMDYYSGLCSMLFQAAERSNHFKELHTYYFHNCITGAVYKDPRLTYDSAVSTDWLLKNFGSDYKVIIVGDALMDLYELLSRQYDRFLGEAKYSGYEWFYRFKDRYPHIIWLNPEEPPVAGGYWGQSYGRIADIFPMFRLTVDGLEQGMKKLLVSK